eukprot:1156048-Pelagomonas_calceolata.AAC.10
MPMSGLPAAHCQVGEPHCTHPHRTSSSACQVRGPHCCRGQLLQATDASLIRVVLRTLHVGVGSQRGQPCQCCEGPLAAKQRLRVLETGLGRGVACQSGGISGSGVGGRAGTAP